MNLLLIRHAATDLAGTLCGQLDPPLNGDGQKQAEALALLLQSYEIGRLYASDLQRAMQTALPLAGMWKVPITARRGLREISFGDWEGSRWSNLRAANPDIKAMNSCAGFSAPGGETFTAFRDRVLRAFDEIEAESRSHDIAIVTHLGPIRVILSRLIPETPLLQPRIDYCAAFYIRQNGLLTTSAPADTNALHRTVPEQR